MTANRTPHHRVTRGRSDAAPSAGPRWEWDGRRWRLEDGAGILEPDVRVRAKGGRGPGRFPLAVVVPLATWARNRPWSNPVGIAFLVFALAPLVLVVLDLDVRSASWALSLYFAAVWFLVLRQLIRPEPVKVSEVAGIAGFTAVLGVALAASLERQLHPGHGLFGFVLGVGLPEEAVKLAPVAVLAFGFGYRHSPLTFLFLGAVSGLAFGVAEAVTYSTGMTVAGYGVLDRGGYILLEFYRFVGDSLLHACLAAISCYFVGLALVFKRNLAALVALGLAIPVVLHGLFDYFGASGAEVLAIAVEAVVVLLFLSYVFTGAQIAATLRAHATQ